MIYLIIIIYLLVTIFVIVTMLEEAGTEGEILLVIIIGVLWPIALLMLGFYGVCSLVDWYKRRN